MKRAEKISTTLAIISLVVSISTPIATYFWLDPGLKAFKDRARLQVSGSLVVPKERVFSSPEGNKVSIVGENYQLKLLNIGKLPAKEIQIVAQYGEPPAGDFVTFDPPSQYEIQNQNNQIFITIKRPLPSQDSLRLNFQIFPTLLTVSTESGETNVIDTGYAASDDYQAFKEFMKTIEARRKGKANPKTKE
jgi:hypothetical protein